MSLYNILLFQASWFRMKHRSRIEREEREDVEKEGLNKGIAEANARLWFLFSRTMIFIQQLIVSNAFRNHNHYVQNMSIDSKCDDQA